MFDSSRHSAISPRGLIDVCAVSFVRYPPPPNTFVYFPVIMLSTSGVLLFITSVCGVTIISSLLIAGNLFLDAQDFLEISLDDMESFKVTVL